MRLQLDTSSGVASQNVGTVAGFSGAGSTASGRTINLSADSVSFSDAIGVLNRASGEHSARIQRLAASVNAGTYGLSSLAITSAIVGNAGG